MMTTWAVFAQELSKDVVPLPRMPGCCEAEAARCAQEPALTMVSHRLLSDRGCVKTQCNAGLR